MQAENMGATMATAWRACKMPVSVRQCFRDLASGSGQRERRRKVNISHRVATTNKKQIFSGCI